MKWARLFRRRKPRPTILMYHRVAVVDHDPWGLAVSPENFNSQVEALCADRLPIGMDEFVVRAQAGDLAPRHVAITFDDAYHDNLTNARPVLLQHQAPATVFAISGALGGSSTFWWDELADICLSRPGKINVNVVLGTRSIPVSWDETARTDRRWRASDAPPGPRESAFLDLYLALQTAEPGEREKALARLRNASGPATADDARSMTGPELQEHLTGGYVTLGGHSVSHPALAKLAPAQVQDELRGCFEDLRNRFGVESLGFAFPYGSTNKEVARAASQAGYTWACSTRAGPLPQDPDMFDLPRVAAADCDGEKLLEVLQW